MQWAAAELEHVGRIASVEDPDIQYAYAQSTVNGMLHLRDALFELVSDPEYVEKRGDLQRVHDKVVRVVKHLIKDYNVNLEEIKTFNTRHVLSNLSYLNDAKGSADAAASPASTNANAAAAAAPTVGGRRTTRRGGRRGVTRKARRNW
jgi:hypothetical protein